MAPLSLTRPCFSEDDGLASISRIGCYSAAAAATVVPRRRGSPRSLVSSCSSPRSSPGRVFDARYEESQPHFLEACSLCKKPLGANTDIFMYRGDMPFCSEECREEQMEMDEAMEKSRSLSSSMKTTRSKHHLDSSQHKSGKSQKYPFRSGIAAA